MITQRPMQITPRFGFFTPPSNPKPPPTPAPPEERAAMVQLMAAALQGGYHKREALELAQEVAEELKPLLAQEKSAEGRAALLQFTAAQIVSKSSSLPMNYILGSSQQATTVLKQEGFIALA